MNKLLLCALGALAALPAAVHAQSAALLQRPTVAENCVKYSTTTATDNKIVDSGITCAAPTGTGVLVLKNSPVLVTPDLGVPSAVDLTNGTNIPLAQVTGTLAVNKGGTNCSNASGTCLDNIAGFSSTGFMSRTGAGTYTFTASSGSGSVVLATSPTLVTPALGTPSAINLTSATNVPVAQATGVLGQTHGGAGTITGALKGNGSGTVSQAACADLSNASASCATDATNASNIGSGTLANARLSGSYSSVTGVGTLTSGAWGATTLAPTVGGTGLTSYVSGDLLYASGTNTLAKLAKGSDGQVLTLASGLPSWADAGGGGGSVTTTGSPTSGDIAKFSGSSSITTATVIGSGSVVLATSPTITTPTLSGATTVSGDLTVTAGSGTAKILIGPSGPDYVSFQASGIGGVSLKTADGTGLQSLSAKALSLTTALPVTSGGTGSATQNFVDLSTTQATIAGVKTFTGQLIGKGTATNDSAAAGYIGEYIESTGLSVGATSNSATNVNGTSWTLAAGDWDVQGTVCQGAGTGTTVTGIYASISVTSATLAGFGSPGTAATTGIYNNSTVGCVATGLRRISVTTTTSVYLVGDLIFAGGTANITGSIRARRIR